jgi:heme/copper-type cytochrome/quinol oxidase subunit 2
MQTARIAAAVVLCGVAIGSLVGDGPLRASCALAAEQGAQRAFTVHAKKYAFEPQRIEVQQDDLVKITLISDDIAHSFTIDDDGYRIARRVGDRQTSVFEFRADHPGTFPFYCNLTADERCKEMRGELVVRGR